MYHHVYCPRCDAGHIVEEPELGERLLQAAKIPPTALATTWIGSRNRALGYAAAGAAFIAAVVHYVTHSVVRCESCGHVYNIQLADHD